MCVHAPLETAKDAILIFKREATWNVCAPLDHIVILALSHASLSICRTVDSLFFRHRVKKSLGSVKKQNKQDWLGYHTTTFKKKIYLA